MSIATIYYDRATFQWANGPYLTEEILRDPARRDSFVAETLDQARQSGATSLGVILHVGDDFATTELKPGFTSPSQLAELRTQIVDEPASVLADTSIQADQAAWRVFPYPAANGESIGTAITMTRQYAPLFESFRIASEKAKFPMITHALSAPLVAIMGLGQSLKPTPGKPYIAILQYPWLTALAFFNEHSDLRLIRTLQHRGLRRPNNFTTSLATAQASLELVDPDLFVVPLGAKVDITLISDLKSAYPNSRVEEVQQVQIEGIPTWCPEPAISTQAATTAPANGSHTFTLLRDEKWALQNFLPTPKEIAEIYPSFSEIKLLKFSKLAQVAALALAACGVGFFGYKAYELTKSEHWSFDPAQVQIEQRGLATLNLQKQQSEQWANLLEDRSKVWSTMESLARLLPASKGFQVKDYAYSSAPAAATAGAKPAAGSKSPISKQWQINGLATEQALPLLNRLNTREGVAVNFNEINQVTGSAAFDPSLPSRKLTVNVKTQENTASKPGAGGVEYPYSFTLVITQAFEATDPMALTLTKAP